MKRLFIILAVLAPVAAAAQTVFPAERLEAAVRACRAGDARAVEAVAALRDAAAEYLAMEPVSVVDKEILPPSGDRRDYMTLSPYWWPDPSREDGLPYIRRDGERNPEVYDYPERVNSGRLGDAAQVLSVLY
ncbi:MAG: alginate lyase family protein, partial [Alistipes sp.]|nr:alginate lyase family protein [Alistipes sp.]